MKKATIFVILLVLGFGVLYYGRIGVTEVGGISKRSAIQEQLRDVSYSKVVDLRDGGRWSHSTDLDGEECDYVCRTSHLSYKTGEVIYKGYCDIDAAFRAWEKSPSHREVLDSDYKYSSIVMGEQQDGDGCYIVMNVAY